MGFLATGTGILGNTARSKLLAVSSSRIMSAGPAFGGTTACVLAPSCNLNNNADGNKLMLMVQHAINRTLDFSVISTKNNLFMVVKDNLPKFSFLRDENYGPVCPVGGYVVQSSCNNWILLTCEKYRNDHLWNPNTNELKSLPYFEVGPSVPRIIYARLRGHGIGFDPLSQDYKTIRSRLFELIGIGYEVHVELFSFSTGSWKEIPYPHAPCIDPFQYNSLHINGFYYWLARDTAAKDSTSFCIISFDFANEKFRSALIPIPPPSAKGRFEMDLGEYHGSLAAVLHNPEAGAESKPCFEVWVWNNETDEWSCVSVFDVPSAAPVVKIVGFCKNDKLLVQDLEGDLLVYDYVKEKLTNLGIRADMREMEVFPYLESSVLADP